MTTTKYRLRVNRVLPLTVLVFAVALLIRAFGVGDVPMHTDEYYTILAARSYADEGVPRIWQGEYVRAVGFTAIVAASIGAFGDALWAARLPSLLASALLIALSFAWLRREADALSGWLLALLLGISAASIGVAQFARFYALHALLFWLFAMAVYALVLRLWQPAPAASRSDLGQNIIWVIIAFASAGAAWHLQEITALGMAALAAWALAALAFGARRRPHGRKIVAISAGTLAIAAIAMAALHDGFGDVLLRAWARYRWSALWAVEHRDDPLFYTRQLARAAPVLFYLFPLAAIVAWLRAPRPTAFCVIVAFVALLLHSFAGMKDLRYVHYLWPFLLVPWAIALATFCRSLQTAWRTTHTRRVAYAGAQRVIPALLAIGAIGMALIANREYATLHKLPRAFIAQAGIGGDRLNAAAQRRASERDSVAALQRLVDQSAFVVTSSELHAIWHVGRFDLLVHSGRLHEVSPGPQFARDPRTGGVVIGEAESLRQVIACRPSGTLLVWPGDWRSQQALSPAVADVVEATMQEEVLPPALGVRAFRWQSPTARIDDCPLPLREPAPSRFAARPQRAL